MIPERKCEQATSDIMQASGCSTICSQEKRDCRVPKSTFARANTYYLEDSDSETCSEREMISHAIVPKIESSTTTAAAPFSKTDAIRSMVSRLFKEFKTTQEMRADASRALKMNMVQHNREEIVQRSLDKTEEVIVSGQECSTGGVIPITSSHSE